MTVSRVVQLDCDCDSEGVSAPKKRKPHENSPQRRGPAPVRCPALNEVALPTTVDRCSNSDDSEEAADVEAGADEVVAADLADADADAACLAAFSFANATSCASFSPALPANCCVFCTLTWSLWAASMT